MKYKIMSLYFFCLSQAFINSGCGVKGDPIPPERAVPLGRGQPSFKEATEDLAYPRLPGTKNSEEKDQDDDEADGDREDSDWK